MCDIYCEYCKLCGEVTGFHLGDFDTNRFEIAYICSKHALDDEFLDWLKCFKFPFCIWSERDDKYVVMSLTENAWNNRWVNHQNLGDTELLEEIIVQEKQS